MPGMFWAAAQSPEGPVPKRRSGDRSLYSHKTSYGSTVRSTTNPPWPLLTGLTLTALFLVACNSLRYLWRSFRPVRHPAELEANHRGAWDTQEMNLLPHRQQSTLAGVGEAARSGRCSCMLYHSLAYMLLCVPRTEGLCTQCILACCVVDQSPACKGSFRALT